jgi:Zn-finger nucleic acid-binding protein
MSQPSTASLTCPKCHGTMRTYERSDVHVDQCTECRGIFLDRGELERLIDAESAFYQPAGPSAAPPPKDYGGYPAGGGHDRGYGGHHGKRKGGFLSELFD